MVSRRVPKSRTVDARITETEVQWAVSEGEKAGSIANEPAEMIRKVLDFKDLTAREVMVPRRKIDGIEVSTPMAQVVALAADGKHSRYPVYRENIDNIVGQLYVKDVFAVVRDGGLETKKLEEIVRAPVMFVSESQPAAKMLADMRSKRLHMAIVSDEFGGTSGLVTLEDILEEIVGEIEDEHDEAIQGVRRQADGSVNVDGDVTVRDLNRAMDWDLPDEHAVTIAGLIIHEAQAIPDPGQKFLFHRHQFQILRRARNQITAVKVGPQRAREED
jgi:Mg2+/Co2+ transporter CorB